MRLIPIWGDLFFHWGPVRGPVDELEDCDPDPFIWLGMGTRLRLVWAHPVVDFDQQFHYAFTDILLKNRNDFFGQSVIRDNRLL